MVIGMYMRRGKSASLCHPPSNNEFIIQIFAGKDPYRGYDIEDALKNGQIPDRPAGVTDPLWALLKGCFATLPSQRPRAREVVFALETLVANP